MTHFCHVRSKPETQNTAFTEILFKLIPFSRLFQSGVKRRLQYIQQSWKIDVELGLKNLFCSLDAPELLLIHDLPVGTETLAVRLFAFWRDTASPALRWNSAVKCTYRQWLASAEEP